MRMMLILVLFCSLAQFVTAGVRLPQLRQEGCGTSYVCWVPDWCNDDSVNSLAESEVVKAHKNGIFNECPALIKFHAYGAYWIHVSIESLAATTKKIVLSLTDTNDAPQAEFSCEANAIEQDKFDGSYTINTINQGGTSITYQRPVPGKIQNPKLKCSFDAQIKRSDRRIFHNDISKIQFKITNEADVEEQTSILSSVPNMNFEMCDPTFLDFQQPETLDSRKIVREVKYNPEKFFCDENFKFEYSADGVDYDTKNAELTCIGKEFHVGGTKKRYRSRLYIRCVAEARIFCRGAVKGDVDVASRKMSLERQPPNPNKGEAMELKCPIEYPHLYVEGKPKKGGIIECLNYGGETAWAIDGTQLGKDGPAAHCEKTIPCNLLRKITSVKRGSVGTDFLPKCHEDGKLFANKEEILPESPRCDESTGDYKYTIGGDEKVVDDKTTFECQYPAKGKTEAEIKNEKNAETFKIGVVIGTVIAVVAVGAVLIVMAFFARKKLKKDQEIQRKAAEAMNKAAYQRYGHKPKKNAKVAVLSDDNFIWNKMMMSCRYVGKSTLFLAGEETVGNKGAEEGVFNFEGNAGKGTKNVIKGKNRVSKDTWPATKDNKEFIEEMNEDYAKFANKKTDEKTSKKKQ